MDTGLQIYSPLATQAGIYNITRQWGRSKFKCLNITLFLDCLWHCLGTLSSTRRALQEWTVKENWAIDFGPKIHSNDEPMRWNTKSKTGENTIGKWSDNSDMYTRAWPHGLNASFEDFGSGSVFPRPTRGASAKLGKGLGRIATKNLKGSKENTRHLRELENR